MALAGGGAVAIWHDIAPEGREAFYAWHGREHMPERVGIPGFLRGRRYVALRGAPEFFNLYETRSPAVVSGPDYLARLNAPTPWTLASVQHSATSPGRCAPSRPAQVKAAVAGSRRSAMAWPMRPWRRIARAWRR